MVRAFFCSLLLFQAAYAAEDPKPEEKPVEQSEKKPEPPPPPPPPPAPPKVTVQDARAQALKQLVEKRTNAEQVGILPNATWEPHVGRYRVAIIADLDKDSKVKGEQKPTFRSFWKEGWLSAGRASRRSTDLVWKVTWDEKNTEFRTQLNEAGRGMELSELERFNGKIYAFDDRSGVVFQVKDPVCWQVKKNAPKTCRPRTTVPRWLLMEGDGESNKGQKTEWATVKNGTLYAGSFGKEYVDVSTGKITSKNNLWVSKIDAQGIVTHEDWTQKYNRIRKTTKSMHPGYQIIEAVMWSDEWNKWFVLPRRVSQQKYDDVEDEQRGSNLMIICDEEITSCGKMEVGQLTPERGFSSAKFLPGTNDKVIVALKSVENEKKHTQGTYITVFDTSGKVLLEETAVPGGDPDKPDKTFKFEGLVFI